MNKTPPLTVNLSVFISVPVGAEQF